MTVRIPDELAAFVDQQVSTGAADSRATAVATALRNEVRRLQAERDAAIYATTEPDADLDAFVTHTAAHPVALD